MSISATNVNRFLDHICQGYARAIGSSAGFGIGTTGGTWGTEKASTDLQAQVLDTEDATVVGGLLAPVQRFVASLNPVVIACPKAVLYNMEAQIKALTSPTSFASLDAFLTYYNYGAGGTNTALQNQYFRALYRQWKGAYPTARNLYFELKQGQTFVEATKSGSVWTFTPTTFTNALRKEVITAGVGVETAGTDISTNYAGGVPYLNVSGFAGTTDTVTVTGTQYDPATGTRTATKTWTVSVTGDETFALASGGGNAASADALICAVSAIAAGSNITDATIYVEAWPPTSRQAVPF